MKYSQARPGRIFVIRLEDGDVEIILFELVDTSGVRTLDAATGFKLLNP